MCTRSVKDDKRRDNEPCLMHRGRHAGIYRQNHVLWAHIKNKSPSTLWNSKKVFEFCWRGHDGHIKVGLYADRLSKTGISSDPDWVNSSGIHQIFWLRAEKISSSDFFLFVSKRQMNPPKWWFWRAQPDSDAVCAQVKHRLRASCSACAQHQDNLRFEPVRGRLALHPQ